MKPIFLTIPSGGLTFGSPGWFWALLLLLPLIWLLLDAGRRREALLSRILAPRLQGRLAGRVSPLKRNLRNAFLLGALALTIAGLAKPRLGYRDQEIKTRGRDVILAIDTSRSMLSTDTAPTRLGRAKLIAQDLLGLLKGDRVGLIAFAGNAFLQAPLTLDKGAVLTSIEDLDSNTIPKGGTDLASAIRLATAAFGKGEGTTRALILMTDGEDLEASGVEAAKEAAAAGIRIFTIGFGSAAGSLIPIRTEDGRNDFVRDETGRPVNSKLDASRLTEIAKATGGFYLPYGQDAAAVIYEKGILPMESRESGTLSGRKPIERYAWPVSAALFLLCLWSLLGEGRGAKGGLLLFLLCSGLLLPASTSRASGLADYRRGDFAGALKDFERRLENGSTASEIRFDAGAAAYKAGDFKKAAGYFSEAMISPDRKIRDAATYNLANSLVRSGEAAQGDEEKLSDWKNALQHYDSVLKADPKNLRAKENRAIVQKLIDDLKKQQDRKKNDRDQKKDQKDKDKDKDQQKNDQSQGGGGGQKDRDQKDKEKNEDQKKNDPSQGGGAQDDRKEDQKENPKQDQNNPKEGNGKDQKQDSGSRDQPGQPTPTPSPENDRKQGNGSEDGRQQDRKPGQQDQKSGSSGQPREQMEKPPGQPGPGSQPTPSSSPTPRKEGALGGGQQGDKQEPSPGLQEAAEAEEGKDGKMSASQARALLRSVQDEEQHVLGPQQGRSVDQVLRDW